MDIIGIFGLVIIPLSLLIWVLFDIANGLIRRGIQGQISDIIRDAKAKLQDTNQSESAQYRISTIGNKTNLRSLSLAQRSLLNHFGWASCLALSSEFHQIDTDDPEYVENLAAAFDYASESIIHGNLHMLALSVGELYLLDAYDRIPGNTELPKKTPKFITMHKDRPLFLVGIALTKIIDVLQKDDLSTAKEIMSHIVDHFPLLGMREGMYLPFFVLKWAERYLDQISDVRTAGNPRFWLEPEKAIVKILDRARAACATENYQNIITVLSTSTDAYRTPRI